MKAVRPLILCQPDDRKGCCACCGAVNFKDLSRERLEGFLSDGARRSPGFLEACDDSDALEPSLVRDRTAFVCPHQGFISPGKPGCLLHPMHRGASLRHASFFGEKICDSFLCPAHSLYSDEQKEILIAAVDDWYYYTLAIIDPASVLWLFSILRDEYGIRPDRDAVTRKILREFLAIQAVHLQSLSLPVFYYSVPEYRLGCVNFSIGSGSGRFDRERSELRAAISGMISSPEFPGP